MAGRVRIREIGDDEGNRLKRIVRRGSGSVVTWRRAQMVLWSVPGMSVAQIAGLAFTSEDRVRDVLHNFNADGFGSLYPRYAGGRPPVFTLAQRREIKKIAKSKPAGHGLPFSRWSLAKLADFLVAEGVVEDISHEGLRALLRAEGVSFQAVKTWKASADPDYAAKKARVDHLYAIADGEAAAGPGDPDVVVCVDEFGPLNLQELALLLQQADVLLGNSLHLYHRAQPLLGGRQPPAASQTITRNISAISGTSAR
jgi:transposase